MIQVDFNIPTFTVEHLGSCSTNHKEKGFMSKYVQDCGFFLLTAKRDSDGWGVDGAELIFRRAVIQARVCRSLRVLKGQSTVGESVARVHIRTDSSDGGRCSLVPVTKWRVIVHWWHCTPTKKHGKLQKCMQLV